MQIFKMSAEQKKIMVFAILTISLRINGADAGQVTVLHSPNSLGLAADFGKQQVMLKDLYAAVLGFSTPQESSRNGINFIDPFDAPEAVVEVHVSGVTTVEPLSEKYKTFPMTGDFCSDTFDFVAQRLGRNQNNLDSSIQVKIHLNDKYDLQLHKHLFDLVEKTPEIATNSSKLNNYTDKIFFEELNNLRGIVASLKNDRSDIKRDQIKDFYHFRFNSLASLLKKYGENSVEVLEAKRLLSQHLEELNKAFVTAYAGEVLVTMVAENDEDGSQLLQQREREKLIKENESVRAKRQEGSFEGPPGGPPSVYDDSLGGLPERLLADDDSPPSGSPTDEESPPDVRPKIPPTFGQDPGEPPPPPRKPSRPGGKPEKPHPGHDGQAGQPPPGDDGQPEPPPPGDDGQPGPPPPGGLGKSPSGDDGKPGQILPGDKGQSGKSPPGNDGEPGKLPSLSSFPRPEVNPPGPSPDDPDYPDNKPEEHATANEPKVDIVILHITFWTCFTMSMALVAIVHVFMSMDPGRDSIVYRLTDNLKVKKIE